MAIKTELLEKDPLLETDGTIAEADALTTPDFMSADPVKIYGVKAEAPKGILFLRDESRKALQFLSSVQKNFKDMTPEERNQVYSALGIIAVELHARTEKYNNALKAAKQDENSEYKDVPEKTASDLSAEGKGLLEQFEESEDPAQLMLEKAVGFSDYFENMLLNSENPDEIILNSGKRLESFESVENQMVKQQEDVRILREKEKLTVDDTLYPTSGHRNIPPALEAPDRPDYLAMDPVNAWGIHPRSTKGRLYLRDAGQEAFVFLTGVQKPFHEMNEEERAQIEDALATLAVEMHARLERYNQSLDDARKFDNNGYENTPHKKIIILGVIGVPLLQQFELSDVPKQLMESLKEGIKTFIHAYLLNAKNPDDIIRNPKAREQAFETIEEGRSLGKEASEIREKEAPVNEENAQPVQNAGAVSGTRQQLMDENRRLNAEYRSLIDAENARMREEVERLTKSIQIDEPGFTLNSTQRTRANESASPRRDNVSQGTPQPQNPAAQAVNTRQQLIDENRRLREEYNNLRLQLENAQMREQIRQMEAQIQALMQGNPTVARTIENPAMRRQVENSAMGMQVENSAMGMQVENSAMGMQAENLASEMQEENPAAEMQEENLAMGTQAVNSEGEINAENTESEIKTENQTVPEAEEELNFNRAAEESVVAAEQLEQEIEEENVEEQHNQVPLEEEYQEILRADNISQDQKPRVTNIKEKVKQDTYVSAEKVIAEATEEEENEVEESLSENNREGVPVESQREEVPTEEKQKEVPTEEKQKKVTTEEKQKKVTTEEKQEKVPTEDQLEKSPSVEQPGVVPKANTDKEERQIYPQAPKNIDYMGLPVDEVYGNLPAREPVLNFLREEVKKSEEYLKHVNKHYAEMEAPEKEALIDALVTNVLDLNIRQERYKDAFGNVDQITNKNVSKSTELNSVLQQIRRNGFDGEAMAGLRKNIGDDYKEILSIVSNPDAVINDWKTRLNILNTLHTGGMDAIRRQYPEKAAEYKKARDEETRIRFEQERKEREDREAKIKEEELQKAKLKEEEDKKREEEQAKASEAEQNSGQEKEKESAQNPGQEKENESVQNSGQENQAKPEDAPVMNDNSNSVSQDQPELTEEQANIEEAHWQTIKKQAEEDERFKAQQEAVRLKNGQNVQADAQPEQPQEAASPRTRNYMGLSPKEAYGNIRLSDNMKYFRDQTSRAQEYLDHLDKSPADMNEVEKVYLVDALCTNAMDMSVRVERYNNQKKNEQQKNGLTAPLENGAFQNLINNTDDIRLTMDIWKAQFIDFFNREIEKPDAKFSNWRNRFDGLIDFRKEQDRLEKEAAANEKAKVNQKARRRAVKVDKSAQTAKTRANNARSQVNHAEPKAAANPQVNNEKPKTVANPQVNNAMPKAAAKPEANHVKPEVNNAKSEANNVKPEANNAKPEANNAKPEVNHVNPKNAAKSEPVNQNPVNSVKSADFQKAENREKQNLTRYSSKKVEAEAYADDLIDDMNYMNYMPQFIYSYAGKKNVFTHLKNEFQAAWENMTDVYDEYDKMTQDQKEALYDNLAMICLDKMMRMDRKDQVKAGKLGADRNPVFSSGMINQYGYANLIADWKTLTRNNIKAVLEDPAVSADDLINDLSLLQGETLEKMCKSPFMDAIVQKRAAIPIEAADPVQELNYMNLPAQQVYGTAKNMKKGIAFVRDESSKAENFLTGLANEGKNYGSLTPEEQEKVVDAYETLIIDDLIRKDRVGLGMFGRTYFEDKFNEAVNANMKSEGLEKAVRQIKNAYREACINTLENSKDQPIGDVMNLSDRKTFTDDAEHLQKSLNEAKAKEDRKRKREAEKKEKNQKRTDKNNARQKKAGELKKDVFSKV